MWSSSTVPARPWHVFVGAVVGAVLGSKVASCAASPVAPGSGAGRGGLGASAAIAPRTTAEAAGARCANGICKCRVKGSHEAETSPPEEGKKRFEIRLSVEGGSASLESPVLRSIAAAGRAEVCHYVDVVAGSEHEMVFAARANSAEGGMAPSLEIAEYGPSGPYWYDVLAVYCAGGGGRCDREAADEWAHAATQRKRGRIDPCGSSVVSKLAWETSGGQHDRDGGRFRDFSVTFAWEIKKFATVFKPGSTECVPK